MVQWKATAARDNRLNSSNVKIMDAQYSPRGMGVDLACFAIMITEGLTCFGDVDFAS